MAPAAFELLGDHARLRDRGGDVAGIGIEHCGGHRLDPELVEQRLDGLLHEVGVGALGEHRQLAVEQLLVSEGPYPVSLEVAARFEAEPGRLGPFEALGGHLAGDHRGVMVLEGAEHRVAEEEADDGEDWSSSVSFRQASSAGAVPIGFIGAKTGSILRPLMPPRSLRSSISAPKAAS